MTVIYRYSLTLYYVSRGMLNHTHSLTHPLMLKAEKLLHLPLQIPIRPKYRPVGLWFVPVKPIYQLRNFKKKMIQLMMCLGARCCGSSGLRGLRFWNYTVWRKADVLNGVLPVQQALSTCDGWIVLWFNINNHCIQPSVIHGSITGSQTECSTIHCLYVISCRRQYCMCVLMSVKWMSVYFIQSTSVVNVSSARMAAVPSTCCLVHCHLDLATEVYKHSINSSSR